jgi:hypothetical protein
MLAEVSALEHPHADSKKRRRETTELLSWRGLLLICHVFDQPLSPGTTCFGGVPHGCPTPTARIARMKAAIQFMQMIPIQVPDDHQFSLPIHQVPQPPPNEVLPIHEAIQIKAAEYWLKLEEADQALKELEKLQSRSWKCGGALRTRIAAFGVLGGRDEMNVQA